MNLTHNLAARLLLSPLRLARAAGRLLRRAALRLLLLLLEGLPETLAVVLLLLSVELLELVQRLRHKSTTTYEISPKPAGSTCRTCLTLEQLPNTW
jgi:hypothetical protein